MKINPDQLKALQELEQAKQGQKAQSGGDFEQLLQNRLEKDGASSASSSFPQDSRASVSQLHAAMQTMPAQSPQPESGTPVMDDLDHVLKQWENYSRQLASPNTSLRETYATLQDIHRDLDRVKEKLTAAEGSSPQLSSIVNELNVMVQTEEIKINRGDYLA